METKSIECRVCFRTNVVINSIYEEDENKNMTYKEMLMFFCNLQAFDEYDSICDDCKEQTVQCFEFKTKCEESDIILQQRLMNLFPPYEVKISVDPCVTLKTEQEDGDVVMGAMQIKHENMTSDDEDKESLHKLATKHGNKTRDAGKMKLRIKKTKNTPKISSGAVKRSIKEELETSGSKETRKKGRKRIRPLQEDNQLTDDGYKKIYECPKCYHFCKSFKMLSKHFSMYHQMELENHNHLNEIVQEILQTRPQYDNMGVPNETENSQEDSKEMNGDEKDVSDDKINEPFVVKDVSENVNLSPGDKMKLFKCIHCEYSHKIFKIMKKHILKHKRGKYIRCEHCDFRSTTVTSLLSHVCVQSSSVQNLPFQCDVCGHAATSRALLAYHMASKHSDYKPYKCELCDFATKIKPSLSQHMRRRHQKEKKHVCPVCDKRFFNRYHMRMHLLIHGGEKQHVCEHCAARFIQKSNLKRHIEVMHSEQPIKRPTTERPYSCPRCSYKAKQAHSLNNHMLIHTGERPHKCNVCPFSCRSANALQSHMLRHSGVTRYSCTVCSYKCYFKDRLKAHSRVHSGERPYECTTCSYRAKTRQRLNNHIKSHLNEQKYSCENCPYTANYRTNLVHHIKKNCGRIGRKYNSLSQTVIPPGNTNQMLATSRIQFHNSDTKTEAGGGEYSGNVK